MAGEPVETDRGACGYTVDGRQSWKDFLERGLRRADADTASTFARLAADIIDGRPDALKSDMARWGLGADARLVFEDGDLSLLELAVAACDRRIVENLILQGADARGSGRSAPLVTAAAKGDADVAEMLIRHGALVEKADDQNTAPLEAAVRQRQMRTVKVLLAHGADVNRILSRNATVLDIVAHPSNAVEAAIADVLKAHGALRAGQD